MTGSADLGAAPPAGAREAVEASDDPAQNSTASAPRVIGRPFKKGQAANPGGRPKDAIHAREFAQAHTVESMERLVFWMRSNHPKASPAAAQALLDRAWGKPTQPITGEDSPLVVQIFELPGNGRVR